MNQRPQELHLGLFGLAVDADEEEDRAERDQPQHGRGAFVDTDREHEAPEIEAQEERPHERLDAWFDGWESQVHRKKTLNGTKKIRRAGFAFVHRFR